MEVIVVVVVVGLVADVRIDGFFALFILQFVEWPCGRMLRRDE